MKHGIVVTFLFSTSFLISMQKKISAEFHTKKVNLIPSCFPCSNQSIDHDIYNEPPHALGGQAATLFMFFNTWLQHSNANSKTKKTYKM